MPEVGCKMLSLRFAVKNLLRNIKYTAGLILVYFFVSVLCVSFFLFNDVADHAYRKILDRQASTAYVSLTFNDSESELPDLTEEEILQIESMEKVEEIEKFAFNFGANYLSLNGGKRVEADISIIAAEGRTVPQAYRTEFSALYDRDFLVCGREPQSSSECLVSEAFVSLVGEESAEELLGQSLRFTDLLGDTVALLTVAGVADGGLGSVSAMDGNSKYFVFTGNDSLEESAGRIYYYLVYSNYSYLADVRQSIEELSLKNVRLSLGNDSYSMKKLAQTSEFISAVLILIAVLCLVACVAFITGTAVLKFVRNRLFYYAAFSVGLSKGKLAWSFLFEFVILAFIAFVLSIPAGIAIVNGLSHLIYVFVGVTFSIELNLPVVLFSLIPLACSALVSVLFVRSRVIYEK